MAAAVEGASGDTVVPRPLLDDDVPIEDVLQQKVRPASPRSRARPHSELARRRPLPKPPSLARDLLSRKLAPIWLGNDPGSSSTAQVPKAPRVQEGVSEQEYLENPICRQCDYAERQAEEHEQAQHYAVAAEFLEESLALRQKIFRDSDSHVYLAAERLCTLCNAWAARCLTEGQHNTAFELLKRAEALTELECSQIVPHRIELRILTFLSLGCYFRARGKSSAALQFIEKAFKLEQRHKFSKDPARTRLNYAALLSRAQRHEEAVEHIETAAALLRDQERDLRRRNNYGAMIKVEDLDSELGSSVLTATMAALAIAYHNLWVEHIKLAKWEEGIASIIRASNIAKQHLGESHALTLKMTESLLTMGDVSAVHMPAHAGQPLEAWSGGAASPPLAPTERLPSLTTPTSVKGSTPVAKERRHSSADERRHSSVDTRVVTPMLAFPRDLASPQTTTTTPRGGCAGAGPRAQTSTPMSQRGVHRFHGQPVQSQQIAPVLRPLSAGSAAEQELLAKFDRAGDTVNKQEADTRTITPIAPSMPRGNAPQRQITAKTSPHTITPTIAAATTSESAASPMPVTTTTTSRMTTPTATAPPRCRSVGGGGRARPNPLRKRFVKCQRGDPGELPPRPATVAATASEAPIPAIEDGVESSAMDGGSPDGLTPGIPETTPLDAAMNLTLVPTPPLGMATLSLAEKMADPEMAAELARVEVQQQMEMRLHYREMESRRVVAEELSKLEHQQQKVKALVHGRIIQEEGPEKRLLERGIDGRLLERPLLAPNERLRTSVRSPFKKPLEGPSAEGFVAPPPRPTTKLHPANPELPHGQRRNAFQVVYQARRAYVEECAALTIQRFWRGFITRDRVQRDIAHTAHTTATRVQSLFRAHLEKKRMKLRVDAAVRIQSRARKKTQLGGQHMRMGSLKYVNRLVLGCIARKRYYALQRATLFFQRIIRGFITRCRLAYLHQMRVKLQKVIRGGVRRSKMKRRTAAVNRIAARWRGCLMREKLSRTHKNALQIQMAWRTFLAKRYVWHCRRLSWKVATLFKSWLLRKRISRARLVRVIQARIRGVLLRGRTHRYPWAACTLQKAWRQRRRRWELRVRVATALILQKHARRHFAIHFLDCLAEAAIRLQRAFRGHSWRCRQAQLQQAARPIQRVWCGAVARWQVKEMHTGACNIQRFVRLLLAARRSKTLHIAIVRLNAAMAGWRVRRHMRRQVASIVCISRAHRGYKCRVALARRLSATTYIQRCWRWYSQRHFGTPAAIRIQALVRGVLVRVRQERLRRKLALPLQAHWRRKAAMAQYRRQHCVVLALQCMWRGARLRAHLRKQHQAAETLQTTWRRQAAKHHLHNMRRAATIIQSRMLPILVRRRVLARTAAATMLQRTMRARYARLQLARRREAARKLTEWFRSRVHRLRFLHRRGAAIEVQKRWRVAIARHDWKNVKLAAKRITAFMVKRFVAMRMKRLLPRVLHLQNVWRRKLTWRRMHVWKASATLLQRQIRGFLCRRRLKLQATSAVKLQAFVRRRMSLRRLTCIRRLHAMTLRLILCRNADCEARTKRVCASQIGSAAKMHLTLAQIKRKNVAARLLQDMVRATLARRTVFWARTKAQGLLPVQKLERCLKAEETVELQRQETHRQELAVRAEQERISAELEETSATRLQAWTKARQARRRYLRQVFWAAPRIQAFARMIRTRRLHRGKIWAVIRIQKTIRRCLVRSVGERRASARTIQRNYRKYRARKYPHVYNAFIARRGAATKISMWWRAMLLVWKHRSQMKSAVKIQAHARTYRVQADYAAKAVAATKIQSGICRRWLCQERLKHCLAHILRIQALARSFIARRRLSKLHGAAIPIQVAWRRYSSNRLFLQRQHNAAAKLQARVRTINSRAKARRLRAVVLAQALYRGWVVRSHLRRQIAAVTVIQKNVRAYRSRRTIAALARKVELIQRSWHRYSARSQMLKQLQLSKKGIAIARGWELRSLVGPRKDKAAKTIQRHFRGWCDLRRRAFVASHAVPIQAWWRQVLVRGRYFKILELKHVLRMLALCWRWRKKTRPAIQLQIRVRRAWEMCKPKARRRRKIMKCTKIQTAWRAFLARRLVMRRLRAVNFIQALGHGHVVRRRVRIHLAALRKIQGRWRCSIARRHLAPPRRAVLRIQAFARGSAARRALADRQRAATSIQRVHRGSQGRVLCRRLASAKGSGEWKHYALRWIECARNARRSRAARRIQAVACGFLSRLQQRRRHRLVTKLQAAWKGTRVLRLYKQKRVCAIAIAHAWWMVQQMRLNRSRRVAATRIANTWRGYCVRQHARHLKASSLKMRRWWRSMRAARLAARVAVEGMQVEAEIRQRHETPYAHLIQSASRRFLLRRKGIIRVRRMVIALQARYRSWGPKREVALLRAQAGTSLNRLPSLRMALAPDKRGRPTKHRALRVGERSSQLRVQSIVHLQFLSGRILWELEDAVAPLQAYVQDYIRFRAVRRIQRVARGFLIRSALKRAHKAATRIQALVRGVQGRVRVQKMRAAFANLGHLSRSVSPEDAEEINTEKAQVALMTATSGKLAGEASAAVTALEAEETTSSEPQLAPDEMAPAVVKEEA